MPTDWIVGWASVREWGLSEPVVVLRHRTRLTPVPDLRWRSVTPTLRITLWAATLALPLAATGCGSARSSSRADTLARAAGWTHFMHTSQPGQQGPCASAIGPSGKWRYVVCVDRVDTSASCTGESVGSRSVSDPRALSPAQVKAAAARAHDQCQQAMRLLRPLFLPQDQKAVPTTTS
jgi:hypothetical protein